MRNFLIVGLGYTGLAIARRALGAGARVMATTRQPSVRALVPGVDVFSFEDPLPYRIATHLVVTTPPGVDGDPVWSSHCRCLSAAGALCWIGYISTTGVYGNRDGAWVEEATHPAPALDRSRRRLAAEQQWTSLADHLAIAIFRTGGIYGPGRSIVDDLRAGTARSVSKPGHAFSRIHRDDIARAVIAAPARMPCTGTQVFHLVDDEPAEAAAVTRHAARLIHAPLPPEVPFQWAVEGMSEMGRSFWSENRRVSNLKTKANLGLEWAYPTFREGLRAIVAEERAEDTPE